MLEVRDVRDAEFDAKGRLASAILAKIRRLDAESKRIDPLAEIPGPPSGGTITMRRLGRLLDEAYDRNRTARSLADRRGLFGGLA